jgi:hypothetical protein
MVCWAAASLVFGLQSVDAAFLHASPKAPAKPATKTAPVVASQPAAAEAIIEAAMKASASPPTKAAKPAAAQPAQPRAKLDVGFSDFEKNLTADIGQKMLRTASGTAWTSDMRAEFEKNVTDALRESMKVILKPLKQSIGKTWMALPQDSQKNEYVAALKSAFLPVFTGSQKTFEGHLELSLKRVKSYSDQKALKPAELLAKSEFSIEDSLLAEHCYEVGAKKSLKSMNKPANASEVLADKKKFCIQSVLGALAHRLNDTQGLISMSMRFDAGAMSLAQKKKKGRVH